MRGDITAVFLLAVTTSWAQSSAQAPSFEVASIQEIAIRLAVGAAPGRVIRSARGLLVGLAGACFGLAPAAWASVWCKRLSPASACRGVDLFIQVCLLLTASSALAAFAAARHIAAVQPADVLRVQ